MKTKELKEEIERIVRRLRKMKTIKFTFHFLLKAILVGFLGWGSYYVSFILNHSINYAIFSACAISGMLWYLLPDTYSCYISKSIKQKQGEK